MAYAKDQDDESARGEVPAPEQGKALDSVPFAVAVLALVPVWVCEEAAPGAVSRGLSRALAWVLELLG